MKALVIGATGAVGKDLVQQLIEDSSVERVDIFVRREVKIPSAKLVAHVVDFDHPETWADQIQGLIRKGNDRFGETVSIAILKAFNAIGRYGFSGLFHGFKYLFFHGHMRLIGY